MKNSTSTTPPPAAIVGRTPSAYRVQASGSSKVVEIPRRAKLIKSTVDRIPLVESGQPIVNDEELVGFALLIGKTQKTYIVQTTSPTGRSIRRTIGRHGVYTPTEARKLARAQLQAIREGNDPLAAKRALPNTGADYTLRQAIEEFCRHRSGLKSIPEYRRILDACFSKWMRRYITTIKRKDIAKRHDEIRIASGHPYADLAMRVLSSVLTYISKLEEDCDDNPLLRHIPTKVLSDTKRWGKTRCRTRVIPADKLGLWFRTVAKMRREQKTRATGLDYLEFVLLTGLRRNEAAKMTWEMVDHKAGTITIPDTKNGEPHSLPLTSWLRKILDRRRRVAEVLGSPWVFPSPRSSDKHLAEPHSVAQAVTEKCGIEFSIHDLRRTFMTVAHSLRVPEFTLKRLVNHSLAYDVTAGYIQFDVDSLRDDLQLITDYFAKQKRSRLRLGEGE